MAKRKRRINAKGRNDTEQYLPIPYSMANHPTFRSLSGPAVKVWIELRSKFNGSNNGKLSLSFQDAATKLGLSKTTVGRAFNELQEKGFIVKQKAGHWYGRKAAEYQITDKPYNGSTATRSWQQWRAPKER
ncbi:helix-turn-helix domain-containing protein [Hirschia maritima]|uniref:helix-turn-helix domain-containing protein n=1 Tax=Hirschia maritima TaxID=1121961 RepID=UPI00036ADEF4|nr:helix-turn-helix domain-containing protein [Hirschia maritima]